MLFNLHSQAKKVEVKPFEEDDSKVHLIKAMEELSVTKAKLKVFYKVFYVLIGVVAMLTFVVVVLVI